MEGGHDLTFISRFRCSKIALLFIGCFQAFFFLPTHAEMGLLAKIYYPVYISQNSGSFSFIHSFFFVHDHHLINITHWKEKQSNNSDV